MEILYYIIAVIALMGLCFFVAKNFFVIAEFITRGEKITAQDKKGLKFLKTKKSIMMFLLINAVFIGLSYFIFDSLQEQVFYSLCSALLTAGFFMDITVKLLPDVFTISLLWLALLASALGVVDIAPSQAIIASIIFYISFMLLDEIGEAVCKKTVIGGGDIKLMAAFGALFGVMQSLILLIMACVIMIIFAGFLKLSKKHHDKELPFGVGLTVSAIINVFAPGLVLSIINYLAI